MFVTITLLIRVLSIVFVDITTIAALKWILSSVVVNIAIITAMQ